MLSSGPAWLGIILLITVSLLPDVLKKIICRLFWPTATERIQVNNDTLEHIFIIHNLMQINAMEKEYINQFHKSMIIVCNVLVRNKVLI